MFIFPVPFIVKPDDDVGTPRHDHFHSGNAFGFRGTQDARDISLDDGCGTAGHNAKI
jgi:hypothetical protein